MVNSNEQNGSEAFTISSPSSSPSTPNFEQHLQSRANDSLAYDDEVSTRKTLLETTKSRGKGAMKWLTEILVVKYGVSRGKEEGEV
jgi:hypothetical protein